MHLTRNPGRALRAGLLLLLSAGLLLPSLRGAEPRSAGEYQIKAVFLFNFTKFIEWPEKSFASTNAPFVISIAGEDPLGGILDEVVRSEIVRGRELVVKRVRAGEPAPDCQILFISRAERDRLDEWVASMSGKPTLLVADSPKALERGVMVNLVVRDSVRMEVNPAAAQTAGLQISSKLLNIATVVTPARGSSPR
ncbi:MAG TPA: YfiR family protein [Verrucomicrobiae bacterium]|nr:YfiR family protein [Verrucomicrobiae bacterium]